MARAKTQRQEDEAIKASWHVGNERQAVSALPFLALGGEGFLRFARKQISPQSAQSITVIVSDVLTIGENSCLGSSKHCLPRQLVHGSRQGRLGFKEAKDFRQDRGR